MMLNEIISDLINSSISLENTLLKTKVLAHRAKNQELINWTTKELEGYLDSDNVPCYRICYASNLFISYLDNREQTHEYPINIPNISNIPIPIKLSISSLNGLNNNQNMDKLLRQEFPITFAEKILRPEIIEKIQIKSIYTQFPKNQISGIITTIKSKLIDFFFKLQDELGEYINLSQIQLYNSQITKIMKQTIITNNGNNSIINTGDNSNINYSVNKGDSNQLVEKLKEFGIPNENINELIQILEEEKQEIINEDTPDLASVNWGVKIKEWMKKSVEKCKDSVIPLTVSTLANIISSFIMGK